MRQNARDCPHPGCVSVHQLMVSMVHPLTPLCLHRAVQFVNEFVWGGGGDYESMRGEWEVQELMAHGMRESVDHMQQESMNHMQQESMNHMQQNSVHHYILHDNQPLLSYESYAMFNIVYNVPFRFHFHIGWYAKPKLRVLVQSDGRRRRRPHLFRGHPHPSP